MFHRCVGALVGLAMMGMAGTANAILIGANDPAFGAGDDGFNLTQDTDTGLEWLDVPLTDNQSFNSVIGVFGAFGFQYATITQICGLFTNFGDVLPNCLGANVADPIAMLSANTLIGLLGQTFGGAASVTCGFFDGGGLVGVATINVISGCLSATPFTAQTLGGAVGFDDTLGSGIGSWLVRPISVPEPSTLALFGIGLAGP